MRRAQVNRKTAVKGRVAGQKPEAAHREQGEEIAA